MAETISYGSAGTKEVMIGFSMKKHLLSVIVALSCALAFMSCDSKIEIPKQTVEEEAIESKNTTLTLRLYEGKQFFVNFIDFGKHVGLSASFAHARRDCSFRQNSFKRERNPIEGVLTARNGQLVDSNGSASNAEGFAYGALLCPECVSARPPEKSGAKEAAAIPNGSGSSPVPHMTMELLDDVRFPQVYIRSDAVLPFPKRDVSIEVVSMKERFIELKVTNKNALMTLSGVIIELGFEIPNFARVTSKRILIYSDDPSSPSMKMGVGLSPGEIAIVKMRSDVPPGTDGILHTIVDAMAPRR